MHPLRQILLGSVLCLVTLGPLVVACGGGLSPVVRCKLEALRVLPKDPLMVTIYDGVDVVERVNACDRMSADGGP